MKKTPGIRRTGDRTMGTSWSPFRMPRRLVGAILLCLLAACAVAAQEGRAKYVFLFIGDGMGLGQRAAAQVWLRAEANEGDEAPTLAMDALPVQGFLRTQPVDALIPDSAAAGTAIACGRKTKNGHIAMDPEGNPLLTIAEIAKAHGLRVGIVTSVSIDHATPACFFAHDASRGKYVDIALQLPASGFDYFAGGPALGAKPELLEGRESPVEVARREGYRIVSTAEDIAALGAGAGKVWIIAPRSDSKNALPYAVDAEEGDVSLADLTRKAVELLDGPDGFFLMVEGGKIDWACHARDAATAVRDVVAFDEAVAVGVAFQRKRPAETLVIVTADHETGGMSLGRTGGGNALTALSRQKTSHARFDILVAGLRAEARPFGEALALAQEHFGLEALTASEVRDLAAGYIESLQPPERRRRDAEARQRYGGYEPFTQACLEVVSVRAGIGWTSFDHTAVPVPLSAVGAGSERFGGIYDNSEVFHRLVAATGLTVPAEAAAEALEAVPAAP